MARGYMAAKLLGVIALVAFLPGLRGDCIGGPYFEEGLPLDFSCTSTSDPNFNAHSLKYKNTTAEDVYGGSCYVSGICYPAQIGGYLWYNLTTPWMENLNTTYFRFNDPDRTLLELNCEEEYSNGSKQILDEQSCEPKFFKIPKLEECSGPNYEESADWATFMCKFDVYPDAECQFEINGTEIEAGDEVSLSTDITAKGNGSGDLYYTCWFKVSLKDADPGTYVLSIILESDPFAAEIEHKFAPFTITPMEPTNPPPTTAPPPGTSDPPPDGGNDDDDDDDDDEDNDSDCDHKDDHHHNGCCCHEGNGCYHGYFPGMGYGPHPHAGYGTWAWSVNPWFRGAYQPYPPIMDMGWYPYRGWFPW